jgi:hypothetical protein
MVFIFRLSQEVQCLELPERGEKKSSINVMLSCLKKLCCSLLIISCLAVVLSVDFDKKTLLKTIIKLM